MFAEIINFRTNGLDIEMEVGSSITLNLDDYAEGTRRRVSGVNPLPNQWLINPAHNNPLSPFHFTLIAPRTLTIRALRTGQRSIRLGLRAGDGIHLHIVAVHSSSLQRSHPEDELLERNPIQTGFLLLGDESPKARFPVQCKWNLHLGPGDDGVGEAILYSDHYVRPGEQFLFPDDHVGTITGVRPIYLRATGARIASGITVQGIEARETPASGCIDEPPDTITVGAQHEFAACTHDPDSTYIWEARNDEGHHVGSWANHTAARATFTAPSDPDLIHVTLTTAKDGHDHVHGVRVWVIPEEEDYSPVAIPQPVQPGDAYDLKRYQIDVRYADTVIELTGADIEFATPDGVPITAPVSNLPVGPFDFTAKGVTGKVASLEATLHHLTYKSLFRL